MYINLSLCVGLDQQPLVRDMDWPSHDITITNIVWCMAYTGGVGGGGVYCAMVMQ